VADAVAALRQAIVTGEMAPGQRLVEPSSRSCSGSPGVRCAAGALIDLTGEGLVERVHNAAPGPRGVHWPRPSRSSSAARCWRPLRGEGAHNVTEAAATELTELGNGCARRSVPAIRCGTRVERPAAPARP